MDRATEVWPIDWQDIYVVSDRRCYVTSADLCNIKHACNTVPKGYREFLTHFGFGQLDGIHILRPEHITELTAFVRESLNEWILNCKDAVCPFYVPESCPRDAVPLAKTDFGDFYFVSPTDPGTLWYLWRPHDWDSNPSIVPLGFYNPFVHQTPGEQTVQFGSGDLIFHPYRELFGKGYAFTVSDDTAQASDTVCRLVDAAVPALIADKHLIHEYGADIFIRERGAVISIRIHPVDRTYYFSISLDKQEEHHCGSIMSVFESAGCTFITGP